MALEETSEYLLSGLPVHQLKKDSSYGSTGGDGALTLATVTVDATVGTKQNLLTAVPANTQRVVFPYGVIARNASADLSGITGGNGLSIGYNGAAADVSGVNAIDSLTTSAIHKVCDVFGGVVGVEGDVLGCIVDPVIAGPATFDVDVFYYDVAI